MHTHKYTYTHIHITHMQIGVYRSVLPPKNLSRIQQERATEEDGMAKCWGWGERGQLGFFNGTRRSENSRVPVTVEGIEDATVRGQSTIFRFPRRASFFISL